MKSVDLERELAMLLALGADAGANAAVDAKATIPLPASLARALSIAGNARVAQYHNRLLAPHELTRDDDGFVVFAEENQSVVLWGYRFDDQGEDPQVYQRQRLDDGELATGWDPEGQTLSQFLVSFCWWNLASGAAPVSCVGEVSSRTARKLRALPVVWACPEFQVAGGDGAFVIADPEGDFYAFGRDESAVRALVERLEPEWVDFEIPPPAD